MDFIPIKAIDNNDIIDVGQTFHIEVLHLKMLIYVHFNSNFYQFI
jgi:hypothetical protein